LLNLVVAALSKRSSPPDSTAGLHERMVGARDVTLLLPPNLSGAGPVVARLLSTTSNRAIEPVGAIGLRGIRVRGREQRISGHENSERGTPVRVAY